MPHDHITGLGSEHQPLEMMYKRNVLDAIFTRSYSAELTKLIDMAEADESQVQYLVGYISNRRNGKVHDSHRAKGTLKGFIRGDIYDLIIEKWGRDEGMSKFQEVFGWFSDLHENLFDEDGTFNINAVKVAQSNLENSMLSIEESIFVANFDNTKNYILNAIQDSKSKVDRLEIMSSNGQEVPEGYKEELEAKITAYNDALLRLDQTRNDMGNVILNS